jgi:hypothetical protein
MLELSRSVIALIVATAKPVVQNLNIMKLVDMSSYGLFQ